MRSARASSSCAVCGPRSSNRPTIAICACGQREVLRQLMLVALDARGEDLPHQSLLLQQLQRALHLDLLQRHHRLARRLLVGGGKRAVERQRIDVGRQFLLLGETAEHARLGGSEKGKLSRDKVQTRRSTIIFLISAIALAGFRPFGQVCAQFMMVWQR